MTSHLRPGQVVQQPKLRRRHSERMAKAITAILERLALGEAQSPELMALEHVADLAAPDFYTRTRQMRYDGLVTCTPAEGKGQWGKRGKFLTYAITEAGCAELAKRRKAKADAQIRHGVG